MHKPEKRIGRRRRGGQPGNLNALKHGRYTAEAKAERRFVRELLRTARESITLLRAVKER